VELEKPPLVSFDQSMIRSNRSPLKSLEIPAVTLVKKYNDINKETIFTMVASNISIPRCTIWFISFTMIP
jgi:hypothetical protein